MSYQPYVGGPGTPNVVPGTRGVLLQQVPVQPQVITPVYSPVAKMQSLTQGTLLPVHGSPVPPPAMHLHGRVAVRDDHNRNAPVPAPYAPASKLGGVAGVNVVRVAPSGNVIPEQRK